MGLPIRAKVLPAALSQEAVAVTAADLKTYLDGLPRILGEHLTVQINGGAVEGDIKIRDLHSGNLYIRGGAMNNQSGGIIVKRGTIL